MAMEIAGHEWVSLDGKWIWYDLQTPRGEDFGARATRSRAAIGFGIIWRATSGRCISVRHPMMPCSRAMAATAPKTIYAVPATGGRPHFVAIISAGTIQTIIADD